MRSNVLHVSVLNKNLNMIKLLLKHMSVYSINSMSKNLTSPLDLAYLLNINIQIKQDIIKLIRSKGGKRKE